MSLLGARESNDPQNYYIRNLHPKAPHPLADTLFEKTVWHKKVSHVVLEERKQEFRVTLLMISPYPHNYKSQNYPLYYSFASYAEAFQKLIFINSFLRKNGVMRIRILGSKIISEKILYPGDQDPIPKPAASASPSR